MVGIISVGVTAFLAGGCGPEKQGVTKTSPKDSDQPSIVLSGDVINITQWLEAKKGSSGGGQPNDQSVVPTDLVVVRDFETPDLAHAWNPVLNPSHEAVTVLKGGLGNRPYAGSGAPSPMGQPLIDFGSSTW